VGCPPPTSKVVDNRSKRVSFRENYLTSIQNSFDKINSNNINQNDAKARPTMIDEIAAKSLERIKKETNHSPITFATVRGGDKGQRTHKSGLLVLLDTGCSHSMMSAAMGNKHVKWKRSTASI
jgi:hypothetical protein